jgi:hypothetical protein
MYVDRPPIPTEDRLPAWRAACLSYRAKRSEGASDQEAHEAAVAAVQSVLPLPWKEASGLPTPPSIIQNGFGAGHWLDLLSLRSPARGSQLGKLATVFRVDVHVGSVFFCDYVEDDTHQHATDGMNGVMPVEAFAHQSSEGRRHHCHVTHRSLVLNDYMRDTMKLWALAHLQVIPAVICDGQIDAFLLIEF